MHDELVLGSQHVEGIRMFHLNWNDLTLSSLTRPKKNVWLPGEVQTAKCSVAYHHNITQPALNCTCGIWSCKSRHGLIQSFPYLTMGLDVPNHFRSDRERYWYISARVEQWGIVIEHEWGYRSEFARIIPQSIQVWPRAYARRNRAHVKELRRRYGHTED